MSRAPVSPWILQALLLAAACDSLTIDRLISQPEKGLPRDRGRGDAETLIIGSSTDAIALDPARQTDFESVEVAEQIYDHLVQYKGATTEVEPGLASSWKASADGTDWTFVLRRDVKFHDGTPLDAEAVVFSFERQRDPSHPYHHPDFVYWKDTYRNIVQIEALDTYTVRIRIERPFAPFLSTLAMFPVSIVSPTAVKRWGADFGQHPVGTGPFRFSSWVRGDRLVLERNDAYWGGRPRLRRLVFRTIPDARQRLIALEGKAIDVAFSILPEEIPFVELHPDLQLHKIAGQNVAYLAMNVTHPPFDDVGVRRAVNHAVNKVPIVKLVYQGLGVPATGPLPPTIWGHREDIEPYPYSRDTARRLLDDARDRRHFDPSRIYTFYVPRSPRPYLPDPESVARVIQRNLADVGVQTSLVIQDFGGHIADVQKGKHDLCILGWAADLADPDNFLHVLLDREDDADGPANDVAFYRDPELHDLLVEARETLDRPQRERLYIRAQEIITRDAPWVPLAHAEIAVASTEGVSGLAIHPAGLIYYRDVWLER